MNIKKIVFHAAMALLVAAFASLGSLGCGANPKSTANGSTANGSTATSTKATVNLVLQKAI